ncbi:lipopolysaccharide biosynthesis protein [Halocatena halophila]|uniref:lipopolysaccharide biosynthesis protein n=1 Tax=Halocatena halophila TaxID=2814576 RepID=UPI002ED15DE0
MSYRRILRSSIGTFATRIGLSVTVFAGTFYLAWATSAWVLGVFSLFAALVRVVDIVTNVGMNEAAKKRISEGTDQGAYFTATILVRVALFVPIAVTVYGLSGTIEAYVGYDIAHYIIAGAGCYLLRRVLESGLIGQKRVARAGLVQFLYGIVHLLSWVVLISSGFGVEGVFLGYLIGQIAALAGGLALTSLRPARPSKRHFWSLFEYAKFGWIGAMTTQMWVWTDTLVLGLFVTPELIGVYELAWRATGVLFLLASAIGSTLFANVSELAADGARDRVTELLERSLAFTGVLAIPGAVGGALLAPSLLGLFGPVYRVGGTVMTLLIVARVFHSYEVILSKLINALDRPDLTFRTNSLFILCNLGLNVLAIWAIGWTGGAIATMSAMILKFGLSYRYSRSLLSYSIPFKTIGREVVAAGVMGVVLVGTILTFSPATDPLMTTTYVTVGGVVYAVALWTLIGEVRTIILRFVGSQVSK